MQQRSLFDHEPEVERMIRYNVPFVRGPHTGWEWQEEKLPAEPEPEIPLISCGGGGFDGGDCDLSFSGSLEEAAAAGWTGIEADECGDMWTHLGTCPECRERGDGSDQ